MAGVGSFVLFCKSRLLCSSSARGGWPRNHWSLGPIGAALASPLPVVSHKSSNTPTPGAFPFSIQGRVTSRPRSKRIQSVGLSLSERLKLQGPGKGKRVYREATYVGPLQSTGLWPQPSPTFQSYSSSRLGQVRRCWEQDEAARGRGST